MQTLMKGDIVIATSPKFTWSEPCKGWDDGAGMVYGDDDRVMTVITSQDADTKWLIDVGPFMDRFGAAKMAVLTSQSITVQAILKDMFARKWIDLTLDEVGQSIDAIAGEVTQVTDAMKQAILTTPVAPKENLALRKLYF